MAITFAYELRKNCLIYQNVQRENPHPLASFVLLLDLVKTRAEEESSRSKWQKGWESLYESKHAGTMMIPEQVQVVVHLR